MTPSENPQTIGTVTDAATPAQLGRYYIVKDGIEKELPLSCGISADFKPRLSLSSIAWRCNRMATADMRPQIEAAGVDIKSGAAWEAVVRIGDGTTRTVGYKLLDARPDKLRSFTRTPAAIATPTPAKTAKKTVAKKATVPAKATKASAKVSKAVRGGNVSKAATTP